MSKELFLVCLVLLVAGLAAAREPIFYKDLTTGQDSVVEVKVHNMIFKASFYNETAEPLPEDVRKFHTALVEDVMEPMKEILEAVFVKGHTYRLVGLVSKVALKFVRLAIYFFRESAALREAYNLPSDKEFQLYAISVFPELIKRANMEMKGASEVQLAYYKDEELRKRFGEHLLRIADGIQVLVARSPVGMYLNFNGITIKKNLLIEDGVEALKFLHANSFGWLIRRLDWLCKKIAQTQAEASVNPSGLVLNDVVRPGELEAEFSQEN